MTRPFVIGVTGNIASGKSLVSGILAELGATVIDSDAVYRELVQPGEPLLANLADAFGPEIVAADGSLDRAALGQIVFSDPAQLARLDAITHPVIIGEVDRRLDAIEEGVAVLDAVKLIESGHVERCDVVWLVETSPEEQVTRLMKRNSLPEAEARRRVNAQPSLDAKRARADLVIDNSGSREATRETVIRAWNQLPTQ